MRRKSAITLAGTLTPGLSIQQALERQARYGANVIEDNEKRGLMRSLRNVATEPMFT